MIRHSQFGSCITAVVMGGVARHHEFAFLPHNWPSLSRQPHVPSGVCRQTRSSGDTSAAVQVCVREPPPSDNSHGFPEEFAHIRHTSSNILPHQSSLEKP